jgi:IPT/TIG domain
MLQPIVHTLRTSKKLGLGLTALSALLLTACLGGGGGLSGGAGGTQVNVAPVLGKFDLGATVRVKDRRGNQIATGKVDANGLAPVTIPSGTLFPVLIEAGINGDTYYDEGSNKYVAVSGVAVAVRALVPDLASLTAGGKVGVTALTEIAVGSLGATLPATLNATSAVVANSMIAQSFGVVNLLAAPTLVSSTSGVVALGATGAADQYALRLAALAKLAKPAGAGMPAEDALMVTHRLRDGLNKATPTENLNAVVVALNAAITALNTTAVQTPLVAPNAQTVLADLQTAANFAIAQLTGSNAAATLLAIEAASMNSMSFFDTDLKNGVLLATAKANAVNAANFTLSTPPAPVLPTVSSISPTSGVAAATVVITGTGFNPVAANNFVRFAGKPAVVTAATATSLTVTVPAGAATGGVTVTNLATYATSTATNVFTVAGSTPPTLYTLTVKVQSPSVPTLSTVATIPNWPAPPVDQATFCVDTTAQINALMGAAVFTRSSCTLVNNLGTVVLAARSGNFTFQFSFAQQTAAFTCPAGQVASLTGCSTGQLYTQTWTVKNAAGGVLATSTSSGGGLSLPNQAQFCANADLIAASVTLQDGVTSANAVVAPNGCSFSGTRGTIVVNVPVGANVDPLLLPNGGVVNLIADYVAVGTGGTTTPPATGGTTNPTGSPVPAFVAGFVGSYSAPITTSAIAPFVVGAATLNVAANGVLTLTQGANTLTMNCVNGGTGRTIRLCTSAGTTLNTNEGGAGGYMSSFDLSGGMVTAGTSLISNLSGKNITF